MAALQNNYLKPALDQIKWGNQCVGDTAWKETAKAAVSVVSAAAELAGVLFHSCSCHKLSVAANKNKVRALTSYIKMNKSRKTSNDYLCEVKFNQGSI